MYISLFLAKEISSGMSVLYPVWHFYVITKFKVGDGKYLPDFIDLKFISRLYQYFTQFRASV